MKKILSKLLICIIFLGMIYKNSIEIINADPVDAPIYGQLSAMKFVEVGNGHLGGVALDSKGNVWTWGWNGHGQLGIGKRYRIKSSDSDYMGYAGGIIRVPYFSTNNIDVVSISASYHTYFALDSEGNVYGWGYNVHNQLAMAGYDLETGYGRNSPHKIEGLPKIVKIRANNAYLDRGICMALDEDGDLWIWGHNYYGQHGNGTSTDTAAYRMIPHKAIFPEGVEIVDFHGGDYHNVVLDSDGNIWTWGNGTYGALGNGTTSGKVLTPIKMESVEGMGKVKQLSVCYSINVVIDDQDQVWQWGRVYDHVYPTVLTGTATIYSRPVKLEIDPDEIDAMGYTPIPQSVIAGESVSYFIDQYGRSWAWGSNRYFGLGLEGGYETTNDIVLAKAQQWPKVMGDGDTQIYNKDPKTPTDGAVKNRAGKYGGYGINQTHPTIYDDKYANNPGNSAWMELALKPIPKIDKMYASRSDYIILDVDGNFYRWSNDGSGTIAWGWDYESDYDITGNQYDGLYDKYIYEVMFMRGVPNIELIELSLQSLNEKIYKSENNSQRDTVTINALIPKLYDNPYYDLTIASELRSIKYVFMPYDKLNDDFNILSPTYDDFMKAYNKSGYEKGELLDEIVIGTDPDNETLVTKTVDINDNGRLWVMINDVAYGRDVFTIATYTADNFYTPASLKHKGIGKIPAPEEIIDLYEETSDNVTKIKKEPDTLDIYGVPLDFNGEVIDDPHFGYDEVLISKYFILPISDVEKWKFDIPQDSEVTFTLNSLEYMKENNFVYEFHYTKTEEPIIIGTKTVVDESGDGIANAGERLTYNLEFFNIGSSDAFDVVVFDLLSDNEFFGSTVDNLKVNDVTYDGDIKDGIDIGSLPKLTGKVTITFDVTLEDPLPGGDKILQNIAVLHSPEMDDNVVVDCDIETDAEPKLIGSKVALTEGDDNIANAGEVIEYTIEYTNTGNIVAEDVVIKDLLTDINLMNSSIFNLKVDGVESSEDIRKGINVGDISIGQEVIITFSALLPTTLILGDGKIINIATAGTPDDEVSCEVSIGKISTDNEITIYLRQIILNSKPSLEEPDLAYIVLKNAKIDGDTPLNEIYNLKVLSGSSTQGAPLYSDVEYTLVKVPIVDGYKGYYIKNIIPMNYKFVSFTSGEAEESQTFNEELYLDYKDSLTYYGTFFIEPTTQGSEKPYSRDKNINDFGLINKN